VTFFRQLTIERLAVCILFVLLFAMAVSVPLDTDTWWHLRSGEYFLDHGEILRQDVFSHTQNGAAWVNHSWGAQVLMALAYRVTGGAGAIGDGGAVGLALYTAFWGAAGMALVYRMCAGTVYSRAFVMVFGAAAAAVFWSARPQMVSFFLSTVILYLLHRYKWAGVDWLWGVPLLMALWVNLHAGYAIGFILLLGFMVGEVAENIFNPAGGLGWRRLGKVGLVTALGVLALALNPYGVRMIVYAFETAGLQTLNIFITEWQSPNFKNPQTWAFLILLFAILGMASLTQRRMAWSDLSLTIGTAFLALWAGRNIAVFAVVATPVLSRLVDAFLEERGWRIRPLRKMRGWQAALNWVLLALVMLGGVGKIATDLQPDNVRQVQSEYLPIAALDYLHQHPPAGKVFNNYNWGGLMIFTLPETPVFVDGRTDLYGDDFLRDYFRAYLGASDWRDTLEKHAIQTALIEKESALTTLLREDAAWQVVYEDDLAAVLVKSDVE